jgi:pimeloyl-ACP methyl ester carboxylesterase
MPANTSSVAQINGIELGYQVVGEGDPLILLHGGFGSVEMFGPNVELLAAGRQVIGVDLQSHGRSPATDRPMRPSSTRTSSSASSWYRPYSSGRGGIRR